MTCPACQKEIPNEPTPKEIEEMTREAQMRILKARKVKKFPRKPKQTNKFQIKMKDTFQICKYSHCSGIVLEAVRARADVKRRPSGSGRSSRRRYGEELEEDGYRGT